MGGKRGYPMREVDCLSCNFCLIKKWPLLKTCYSNYLSKKLLFGNLSNHVPMQFAFLWDKMEIFPLVQSTFIHRLPRVILLITGGRKECILKLQIYY